MALDRKSWLQMACAWFCGGGGQMRGIEIHHVISGPIRGLKINCISRGQHSKLGHYDSMTDLAESLKICEYHTYLETYDSQKIIVYCL